MAGNGINIQNTKLKNIIYDLNLEDRVFLIDQQKKSIRIL